MNTKKSTSAGKYLPKIYIKITDSVQEHAVLSEKELLQFKYPWRGCEWDLLSFVVNGRSLSAVKAVLALDEKSYIAPYHCREVYQTALEAFKSKIRSEAMDMMHRAIIESNDEDDLIKNTLKSVTAKDKGGEELQIMSCLLEHKFEEGSDFSLQLEIQQVVREISATSSLLKRKRDVTNGASQTAEDGSTETGASSGASEKF